MRYQEKSRKKLTDLDLKGFMEAVAAGTPLPGGGSVISYIGALGVALGTMTANLSARKRGLEEKREEFTDLSEEGNKLQVMLFRLVDEDREAYDKILWAYRLPGNTAVEKMMRSEAVKNAFKEATLVQYRIMEAAFAGLDILYKMVEKGMPGAVADAAAGVMALRACIQGAFLNIRVNAKETGDNDFINEMIEKGREIESRTSSGEEKIINLARERYGL
jgi:glutamate formiminotransferase/formiminotetrahydrofolate cyclodeaminase